MTPPTPSPTLSGYVHRLIIRNNTKKGRLCQGVSVNQGLIHEGGDTTDVTQVKSKKTFQEGGLVKRWKKLVESRRESQQNSQLSARNIMSGGSSTVHQGEIDVRNFEKCDPSTTCLSQDMI